MAFKDNFALTGLAVVAVGIAILLPLPWLTTKILSGLLGIVLVYLLIQAILFDLGSKSQNDGANRAEDKNE